MTDTTPTTDEQLLGLIERYWMLAHAEGAEGRTHDTEAGDAQKTWHAIKEVIAAVAAERERCEAHRNDLADTIVSLRIDVGALKAERNALLAAGSYTAERLAATEAERDALLPQLDAAIAAYERMTAYTIAHDGVMRFCSDGMRDAYSAMKVRAEKAEAELADAESDIDTLASHNIELQAERDALLADAEFFRWLSIYPNFYSACDLLRADQYVTLRRVCEALVPLDKCDAAMKGEG